MDTAIRRLCAQAIGGDHQRLHTVSTKHVGVTFKHLLLPVWLASYRYQDKSYRVLVNGQTGKVTGDRPYSWIKISLLVLIVLAVVGIILSVVAFFGKGSRTSRVGEAAAPPTRSAWVCSTPGRNARDGVAKRGRHCALRVDDGCPRWRSASGRLADRIWGRSISPTATTARFLRRRTAANRLDASTSVCGGMTSITHRPWRQ